MTTERYAPFRREISIKLKPWSVQYRFPVEKKKAITGCANTSSIDPHEHKIHEGYALTHIVKLILLSQTNPVSDSVDDAQLFLTGFHLLKLKTFT